MNSDEFKANFKKYRMGTLTHEEEERFENELEKLDEYQAFLEAEIGGAPNRNHYNPDIKRKILRRSQLFAYFRIGFISVVISLLLLPTLNVLAMALNIIP